MSSKNISIPDAETLYRNASCALLLTDKAGLILKVNETFCQWTGCAAGDLVEQRRIQELLTVGSRMFYQTHWIPLLEMQRSVAEVQFEFRSTDGRTVPMVVNATRREHEGFLYDEISAVVIAQRALFEQELKNSKRMAEAALREHLEMQHALSVTDTRLRIALESAQLYVWDVDLRTNERRYDPQVALLLGFSNPLAVSASAYDSFIDPADATIEARLFQSAMDSPAQPYRCVYRLNGVDGVQRTVVATGRGITDSDNRFLHFVGVLHDITQVSRQQALAEDRALFAEQMIGIVSHDLRNPLQIISMATHRIALSTRPAEQVAMLGHLRTATHRAQKLINELLDFTQARIGQGLAVSPVMIDLRDTLNTAVEAMRFGNPGWQIDLELDGLEHYHVDADRLVQLLGNLVANAVAYGEPTSPIRVTADAKRYELTVAVHNLGVPIPAESLHNLFEPMTRGAGEDRSLRSVGLGLYIVSEIAKAHGGTVHVDSSETAGTTFTVKFPAWGSDLSGVAGLRD
ncbi:PAS domain-containing sensor histidine kinase [Pseudomonas sp. dw_358]|uniref:sensor histidine kinase n=1 Tax=Pseudomonas sp. dw_358 TaxID=2720083 RepID=UPI001BD2F197|nr:PAS domain-containing sensor histidine kinase [Pseudomonas sp. dw_358]